MFDVKARSMFAERQSLIASLFEEYIEMYASRDKRLISLFSENFNGFSGSSNILIKDRSEWIQVILSNFAQVPTRIGIEILDSSFQDVSENVVMATAFFHIKLPISDEFLSNKAARLVLVFHNEPNGWKIVHSGISIPYGKVNDDEIYPMSDLEKRNLELKQLVELRTKELSEANKLLHIQSNTDSLTNVSNRRHFDFLLEQEWNRAQRIGGPLELLMIDIDNFKNFNDSFGHLAGDKCVQRVALGLVQSARRAGELVARYGGDEFVIILPNPEKASRFEMADKIKNMIVSLAIPNPTSPLGLVTVSIGSACLRPSNQHAPDELVRLADLALYRAKSQGRNCVEIEDCVWS